MTPPDTSTLAAARAEADAWRETAHLLASRLMDLGTRPKRAHTMPRCAITDCQRASYPGWICTAHQRWTASRMRRCLEAIEAAVVSDDGLDGRVAEQLLRELGQWPTLSPWER
mgnify:FL=1